MGMVDDKIMYGKNHLILSMPIYVLAVRYLSFKELLLSPYLFVFCIATMIGSLYPDIDWSLGFLGFRHRSPLTHSFILPLGIHILLWYYLPKQDWITINLSGLGALLPVYQAFLIGVASHLVGDNIQTGNLVKIPKVYEKYWYTMQGLIVIYFLYLTNFFNVTLIYNMLF